MPPPESVHVAVPFSFRQPNKDIKNVKMHNDFGSLLINMKLFETVKSALPFYKSLFAKMKTSLAPFGVLYSTKLVVWLPFTMPKMLGDDLTSKFSFVYSNLNASKTVYEFNGAKMRGQFFFAPGVNKLSSGFSVLTIGHIMSVAAFSDEVCMKNPQLLVDAFVRINSKCMEELKED